ncbi:MAG: MATE family efflux transporter [Pirellulales bacterium]|nr:MATE family efflux transporter [Pirellulales bacterium]
MTDEKRLPTAGGMRELTAIALPMVVSQACDTVMIFTDRLFLSRLGPEQMNAALAGGLSCFMLTTFLLGLVGYTTALVAQYLGAGRKDRCAVATTQAAIICLAAYPLVVAARPAVMHLFNLLDLSAEQLIPQKIYFGILVYAVIVSLLRTCLAGFFSGIGKTRMVMIASVAAMVVNVGLNYVLIFGHLGVRPLGIRGAAFGTICGGLFGFMVLAAAYLWPSNRREYAIARSLRFDREAMGRLVRFGYPAGIEFFLNVLAFTGVIMVFHARGDVTATAATVMFNWDLVSFVPLIGVQIGVTSLVGRYMGAGSPDTAHRATMSGLKLGVVYSSLIFVLFLAFPGTLVAMFEPSEPDAVFTEAIPTAVFMIRFASLYVLIDAAVVVFSGALRGAGDTFWAMCISVGLHWLLLPILAFLLHVAHVSAEMGWVALVLTYLVFSGLFYLRYRSGRWRTIRVVQTPEELLATDHDHEFHQQPDL